LPERQEVDKGGISQGMDERLRARLRRQLSRGDLVLFTGAGFSRGARNPQGAPISSVQELKEAIWLAAFPGTPLDEGSQLGDVFEVAIRNAGNATRQVLEACLTVDASTLPEFYQTWFSMPWLRGYTVNIDDLDQAVIRAFGLPRQVRSISALSDELPALGGDLLMAHLNGTLGDYPNITFSAPQYGERVALPDAWYSHLVTDILSHPILFVGTSLDEPPLWHHLAARGRRARRTREHRPGSYLVSPSLPEARQRMLEEYNVDWINMDAEEFAVTILQDMAEEARRGFQFLEERLRVHRGPPPVQRVADLRAQPNASSLPDFLLGREPVWADLTEGFAVERNFEGDLKERLSRRDGGLAGFVTGTAGAGKSITLRRLALEYQAEGLDVLWIDMQNEVPLFQTRRLVQEAAADVVVVDDIDGLRDHTVGFVRDLLTDTPNLLLLASARSTRFVHLRIAERLRDLPTIQFAVPNLEDSDIELLIDALERARRLGKLQGMTHDQQVAVFRDKAGRQLLVAMVEATSGEKFDEKIDRECAELTANTALAYSIVAVATNLREHVSRDELLLAFGDADNEALDALDELLRGRLVLEPQSDQLAVRHRYIADRVVDYFRNRGMLATPLQGLTYALAASARLGMDRRSRVARFLVKLLNHDMWLRQAGVGAAREAYESVEPQLHWDSHFWLHRGSVEVEAGDLRRAENFLNQARGIAPGDPFVETEWAYMNLKRAAQEARAEGSLERAQEAIGALDDAIEQRGRLDSYPFHILGSQGLSWVRRAPVTREKKIALLAHMRETLRKGKSWHPYSEELIQIHKDVEAEYLGLAVVEGRTGEEA